MAQRIFATANDPEAAPDLLAPDDGRVEPTQRQRAAAYLDLWERQLRYAAAMGPVASHLRRKPGA